MAISAETLNELTSEFMLKNGEEITNTSCKSGSHRPFRKLIFSLCYMMSLKNVNVTMVLIYSI